MAEKIRVRPDCVNASNPYHECVENCFKKIAEAKEWKGKRNSDNHNGVKEHELSKKMSQETRVHPACTNASNPYHECVEFCYKRISEAEVQEVKKESGSIILGASQRFGRRKRKGFNSLPKPRQGLDNEQHSEEIHSQDSSLDEQQVRSSQSLPTYGNVKDIYALGSYNNEQVLSSQSLPTSGIFTMPDSLKGPSKNSVKNKKPLVKPVNDVQEGAKSPVLGLICSSDSDIDHSSESSDEVEAHSVTSDSRVCVLKYYVKASISSILQSIFDKYGDIAASCQLESVAMRTYYLECVCSVVKELQSASLAQLTKSRVKEMLAILKDVESSKIDVGWLGSILNEIMEVIEFIRKHDAIKEVKAECELDLESTRKELESQMEDLALKEKEVADAKAQVAETSRCLSELELKSSQLNETISSAMSKVEKYLGKSLADEISELNSFKENNQ